MQHQVHFVVVQDPGCVGVAAVAVHQPTRKFQHQGRGRIFPRMNGRVDKQLGFAARHGGVGQLQHLHVVAPSALGFLPRVTSVQQSGQLGFAGHKSLRLRHRFFHRFIAGIVGNGLQVGRFHRAAWAGFGLACGACGACGANRGSSPARAVGNLHLRQEGVALADEVGGRRKGETKTAQTVHVSSAQLQHQVALGVVCLHQLVMEADGRLACHHQAWKVGLVDLRVQLLLFQLAMHILRMAAMRHQSATAQSQGRSRNQRQHQRGVGFQVHLLGGGAPA